MPTAWEIANNTFCDIEEFKTDFVSTDSITTALYWGPNTPTITYDGSYLRIKRPCKSIIFNGKIPEIERIYVNENKRTIVVKWLTGERTKVKCAKGDTWNVEAGINAAIVKYITKSNHAYYKDIHKKIEYQD